MVVKIQDGSLVPASDVFGGVEDDEGQSLKFEPVKDALVPRWEAKTKMNDGSNRTRNFSVSLLDVNLVVRMTLTEEAVAEEEGKPKPKATAPSTEKVTKEVTPTETKKNSSPTSDYQKYL